jgi:hypothetical protein
MWVGEDWGKEMQRTPEQRMKYEILAGVFVPLVRGGVEVRIGGEGVW